MPTKRETFQIVDENGRECLNNQEGELRILLSNIDCHGYLDDEEASARVFRDGFFYPGDMAMKREDGRIRILGRTTDVVILNAQKIAAAPIEQAIRHYLRVDEVCLFSGLSDQGHEEVIVVIQSDRGIKKSELETVAHEFIPSERVRFSIRKDFPRTGTGMRKAQRALLKKLVFEELNAQENETRATAAPHSPTNC
jgi:acyl-coenzyme A synthetase/AMP-(fatty) acid ligase